MLGGLPPTARARFERLHARCLEMRHRRRRPRRGRRSAGGRGGDPHARARSAAVAVPAAAGVEDGARPVPADDERAGDHRRGSSELRKSLAAAQAGGDERIVRSLQDSIAIGRAAARQLRRARRRTPSSSSIELDRIEGKIQALAEMAVNRQDPDFLSSQVDSAAESMRQTEKAVSELQHLTGLADQLRSRRRSSNPTCARCCGMTPERRRPTTRPRRAARSCPHGSRRGRRSSPISTSRARPRRSCCTATPTTLFRIGDGRACPLRRARRVPGRAAVRPLVAGAALRPRPRAARVRRPRREAAQGDGRARQPARSAT